MAKKKQNLSQEELLEEALVPEHEWPYKVPENWVWTKLDSVSEIVTGGTPSKNNPDFYNGTFPFIKPADLDQGRHVLSATEYLSEEGKNVSRVIPQGSTSVCCIGTIGKSGYLEMEATTNQQINSIVPKIDSLFIYYYCNSDVFINQLNSLVSATTISIVNKGKMSSIAFPLPPLTEQQRIVERIESLFEKLDQAKGFIQDALDSFENRKAAILNLAFRGKLTKKWREDNEIGMESWGEKRISEVCKINPPKADIKNIEDSISVSFIPMSSVSDVYGRIEKPQQRALGEVKKGYTNFSEGDVIFAKITPCMENGKTAIVGSLINGIGYGSTEFHVLRCNKRLYNQYLYHVLRSQSFRDEAKSVMTGAVGQQRVPKSFLEDYKLHLPTIDEQIEIAKIINASFEKEHSAYELYDLVENVDLMKKSILARAFRGELGTNDPDEESAIELLKSLLEGKVNTSQSVSGKIGKKRKLVLLQEEIYMSKKIKDVLSEYKSLTPEKLKEFTGIKDIDDFYTELKNLIDTGMVIERRKGDESYLEVDSASR